MTASNITGIGLHYSIYVLGSLTPIFFYYFIVINQYVITLLPISISAQNYVVISMADTTTALMLNTVQLLKR